MERDERPGAPRTYLTLPGIPASHCPKGALCYYWTDGVWRPTSGDLLHEIDDIATQIHDAFESYLFPRYGEFHQHLREINPAFFQAGLNSECTMSAGDFEALVQGYSGEADLFRLLYLFDCQKLVSGIQECTKEAAYLVGEFYRILNLEPLDAAPYRAPDGYRFVTSPAVTRLTGTLAIIYVRLHSLLDYLTKLAVEVDQIRTDFRSYPKLASAKILYGDKKRLSWDEMPETLLERCDTIHEVELVRNLVIHDGLLDDRPKAYIRFKDGEAAEKFVLMPDREGPRWSRYRNRRLFYRGEDRVNLRLPHLLADFQHRQVATMVTIRDRIRERTPNGT